MPDQTLLYKYKGDKCEYCGLSTEEMLKRFRTLRLFDFNHTAPSKKSPVYESMMGRKNLSSEHFDEIDKCALLCSNCHRILHGQNITETLVFTISVEGMETIEHEVICQFIFDDEKQEAYIFSDKILLLTVYKVCIGEQPPVILTGIQLEPL